MRTFDQMLMEDFEPIEAQDIAKDDTVLIYPRSASERQFTVARVRAGFTGEVVITTPVMKRHSGPPCADLLTLPEDFTVHRLKRPSTTPSKETS